MENLKCGGEEKKPQQLILDLAIFSHLDIACFDLFTKFLDVKYSSHLTST